MSARTGVRLTAVVSLLAAVFAFIPGAATAPAAAAGACATSYGSGAGDSFVAQQPVSRSFYDASGPTTTNNCIKVTVSKHADIRNHERLTVSWSGAHTTGGRSLFPYGDQGLPQEYPVALMECRGTDPKAFGGSLPTGAEATAPSKCWTSTWFQRTRSAAAGTGIWEQDASNHDSKAHLQGVPAGWTPPADCSVSNGTDYLITPFKSADPSIGLFGACSQTTMPAGAGPGDVSIPNDAYGFTGLDGTGSYSFEALTVDDKYDLGCSYTTNCTLEIIPINGINCDNPDPSAPCNATGNLPAGKINPGQAPQDAVAPAYWMSATNWNNRIPVPLSFAKPRSVCTFATSGAPVAFYGTELLGQAAIQWSPAYCTDKKRFNWQSSAMTEEGAYNLMASGAAPAAEVMSRTAADTNVAYAPTAVTGWGISFVVDGLDGNPVTQLKLTPRLLAKLLTESYPGSFNTKNNHGLDGAGKGIADLATNPLSLNRDPEFVALNPGIDSARWSEAAASILATSTDSDAIYQLTSYIAHNKAAMDFINGTPQVEAGVNGGPGYTVKVNQYYKGIKLPVRSWPQLDKWVDPNPANPCLADQGSAAPPYLQLVAAPVASMDLIATALGYSWPNVDTGCNGNGSTQSPYQLARVATQGSGARFMLGLVNLGDAARMGLNVASLETTPGNFVKANNAGMAAAIGLLKPTGALLPFTIDQADIAKSATAYPGTEVIYTAAKTTGLSNLDALHVAQFIQISSTEGQIPGRGNGQLAAGYLPIVNKGATAVLFKSAQAAAEKVAAQIKVVGTPTPTPTASASSTGAVVVPPTGGGTAPTGGATASSGPKTTTDNVTPTSTFKTQASDSSLASMLLPLLLVIGLLGGLAAFGGRLWLATKGAK